MTDPFALQSLTRCRMTALIVWAAAGLAGSLLAGPPPSARTQAPVPPIVVTARGVPRPQSKTPGSVAVIERERILQQVPVSVSDALQLVPGVTPTADGAWGADLNIRGLSRESVVLLIDGCRVNTATDIGARFGLVDPMEIERVELLKGPISALYGSGSIGGVVSILTHRPAFTAKPTAHALFTLGLSSNPFGGRTFCAAGESTAKTAVYLSQSLRDYDSYRDGDGNEVPNSQFRDMQTKLRFACRPARDWRLDANLQYFRGEKIGVPGSGTAPLPARADVTYPETQRYLCSLTTTYAPPPGRLRQTELNVYHQRIERQARIDNFPAAQPMLRIDTKAPHDTYGAKWLVALEVGRQTVSTGLDVWQRRLTSTRVKTLKSGLRLREQPLPDAAFTAAGLFAEDDWEPVPNVVLNAGGRLDAIHVENDATEIWDERVERENSWNLHLGATWSLTEMLDAKFIVGSGYRAATIEERYQYLELGDGRVKYGDPALVPERSRFAEGGLECTADRLAAGATVFVVQLEDLIGERVRDPRTIVNANIDEAQIHGVEFHTMWLATAEIEACARLSYACGRDTRNDEYLPDIAPLTASVGIDYGRNRRKGMFAGAETVLAAEQDNVPDGFNGTPAWCAVDLRAGWRHAKANHRHSLALSVRNLFDTTYRNHLTTYRGILFNQPGRAVIVTYSALL